MFAYMRLSGVAPEFVIYGHDSKPFKIRFSQCI